MFFTPSTGYCDDHVLILMKVWKSENIPRPVMFLIQLKSVVSLESLPSTVCVVPSALIGG